MCHKKKRHKNALSSEEGKITFAWEDSGQVYNEQAGRRKSMDIIPSRRTGTNRQGGAAEFIHYTEHKIVSMTKMEGKNLLSKRRIHSASILKTHSNCCKCSFIKVYPPKTKRTERDQGDTGLEARRQTGESEPQAPTPWTPGSNMASSAGPHTALELGRPSAWEDRNEHRKKPSRIGFPS